MILKMRLKKGKGQIQFFFSTVAFARKKKHLNDGFISYKQAAFHFTGCLTNGLDCCGLLADYFDVFMNCLGSHSDGTHSLLCTLGDVIKNLFILGLPHFYPGWLEAEYIFS